MYNTKQAQTPAKSERNDTFLLVMPAYNEETKIEKTIVGWKNIIEKVPGSQILVVNDGSTDNTGHILNKLTKKYKFLKVISKTNEGHGKTVFRCYTEAVKSKHPWIFQTDSDGHFNPNDFFKLWKKRSKSKFILGFRQRRQDPIFRLILSLVIRFYILLCHRLFVKDANIPFRLIERNYLKKILPKVPKDVFAPNIFLSIIAKKEGQKLYNISVPHQNHYSSHLNFQKVIRSAFKGIQELETFRRKEFG